jgi:hypothetical protein
MKKWLIAASVLLGVIAMKAATVLSATAAAHGDKCPLCWRK